MNMTVQRRSSPILLLMCLTALALPALQVTAQSGTNRAALVVRFEDGSVQSSCVSFQEETITGEELLRRAGFSVILDYGNSIGNAVCSINSNGCSYPIQDCFCRCMGVQCEYWAYYHWVGTWQYSQVGANSFQVTDGALDGWSWGPGNFSAGTQPPDSSFEQICAAPTATPSATATATTAHIPDTPTPTATTTTGVTVALPQISATVSSTQLRRGECALLSWVTWDSEQVVLNGTGVMAQDRLEVCPTATERYTFVATNAGGQTVREVVISVADSAQPPTAAAANPPTGAIPTAYAPTVASELGHIGPLPSPSHAPAPPTVTPERGLSLVPVAEAASAASPLEQESRSLVDAPRPAPVPPEPTATPWPRAPLGIDGRPTPTPMLVARVSAGTAGSETDIDPRSSATAQGMTVQAAQDAAARRFSPDLLSGYGSFFLATALLVGAGAVVTKRRAN